jgi:hypothetical protein
VTATAHTPGPWRWDDTEHEHGETGVVRLIGPDGQRVIFGWGHDWWGIGFGQSTNKTPDDRELPDALLIASAPDLLEALEWAVRVGRHDDDCTFFDPPPDDHCSCWYGNAQVAIQKARTGR